MTIPIFKAEASVKGLAEKITASSSILYASKLEKATASAPMLSDWMKENKDFIVEQFSSVASLDDPDLYETKSIYVSSNWNLNDDVFTPAQIWPSRNTPRHKRTNLEHDETNIVGHMTTTWAYDNSGSLLDFNLAVDELPNVVHLANGAVIYKKWEDDKLQEQAFQLIEDVESGDMFVSMECIFGNFGYCVLTADNELSFVERNSDTAFLTKHLRAYGGDGLFDGNKVGRWIIRPIFSGKGYVKRPANPNSFMLDSIDGVDFGTASINKNSIKRNHGVLLSCTTEERTVSNQQEETKSMSDTNTLLEQQNKELKTTLASMQEKFEKLQSEATSKNLEALEAKISTLESAAEEATAAHEATKEKLTASEEKVADLEKKVEEVTSAKATVEEELEAAKSAQVTTDRVSMLVAGGVDKETAEAKVETYKALSKEQFEDVAKDIIAVAEFMKKKEDDKKKGDDKGKDDKKSKAGKDGEESEEESDSASASTDEKDLEDAETDETPNLSAANEQEVSKYGNAVAALSKKYAAKRGIAIEDSE